MRAAPLTALFVGSDLAPLRPVRMELRRRGAKVDVVLDEVHARSREAPFPPDLVVLDGTDEEAAPRLIRHFRELGPETKILHVARPDSSFSVMDAVLESFPGRLDDPPAWHPVPPPVLLVDDDEAYLASLVRLLRRNGYSVLRCSSPHEALDCIARARPRLALLDVMLPGMTGIELAERIRIEHPDRPSLAFLTADESSAAEERGLGLGADFYLRKPCDVRTIMDVVDYLAGDLDEPERELLRARLG